MSATGKALAEWAKTKLGMPYVYGTDGALLTSGYLDWLVGRYGRGTYVHPSTGYDAYKLIGKEVYDCRGLVNRGMILLGVPGHDTNAPGWYIQTKRIGAKDVLPGDLCFYAGAEGVHHVGICVGNGDVVQAAYQEAGTILTHNAGSWDYYGRIPWLDYGTTQPSTPPPAALPYLWFKSPWMQGDAVRMLQTKLKAHGCDPGDIDGIFGPMTNRAVLAFQTKNHLAVDGIVGPITWGALNK